MAQLGGRRFWKLEVLSSNSEGSIFVICCSIKYLYAVRQNTLYAKYAPPTTHHPPHNKWDGSLGENQKNDNKIR